MTIDVHVHLSESKDDQLRRYADLNCLKYTLPEYLSFMNKLGITRGLLLSPPLQGGQPLPNENVLEICARSKGKLLAVLTVEPAKKACQNAILMAKKRAADVKGFKVRLGYHAAPATDPVFDPIYDYSESAGLPVMFHTGDTATSTGSLKLAHPLSLDELANLRPRLKIVACHFGNPWIDDVAELIYKHENVFADISGLFAGGGLYTGPYLAALARRVSEAIYYVGSADKVLYGSDYPVTKPQASLALVRTLRVSDSDKKKILSTNARRLFNL